MDLLIAVSVCINIEEIERKVGIFQRSGDICKTEWEKFYG